MLCHRVSLDDCGRLSLHSVIDGLTAPELPIHVREMTVVAKLDHAPVATELGLRIAVARPLDLGDIPEDTYGTELFVTGQYAMGRLLGLPIIEQGIHRIEVALMGQAPSVVDVPVFAAATELERVH